MNKQELQKAVVPHVVAGYPNLAATAKCVEMLDKAGAEIIEIAIPFSDPVAEGETVAQANTEVLKKGIDLDEIFAMCKALKIKAKLAVYTYMNPVFVYGVEKFMKKCKDSNIEGIVIPDLPYEEKQEIKEACEKYEVEPVTIIALNSGRRIAGLAADAKGFICLLTPLMDEEAEALKAVGTVIEEIRKYSDLPVIISSELNEAAALGRLADKGDGVIIASEITAKLAGEDETEALQTLYKYIIEVKKAAS